MCRIIGLLLTLIDNGPLVGGGIGGWGGLDEARGEELNDVGVGDGV